MSNLKQVESISDVQFKIADDERTLEIKLDQSDKDLAKEDLNDSKNELSFFEKICFGVAGLPYQAYFCAIGVFTTVYLLNNAGLPPKKTTYILFISRITDAITDPIYGLIVNKTKITRFGKMKPWIAVSIPLCAISYIMMWYKPESFSENQLFIWYTFWHSFQFTVITGYRIPHTAMTMYLSHSKKEREIITIFRMGFEMIGLLLALVIQAPFVSTDSNCIKLNTSSRFFFEEANETNTTDINMIDVISNWEKNKYTYIAIIMTFIFIAGTLPVVFFVKEKPELIKAVKEKDEIKKKATTLQELKRIFTFKPYLLIIGSTIFTTSSIQIIQNNLQLYFEYGYTAIKSYFMLSILTLLGCAILFVPFWKILMTKMEKNHALMIGNLLMIPLLIGVLFFKSNSVGEVLAFFLLAILAANCFTAAFLIPPALIPEALDAYYIKYRAKPDALFYTFFTVGTKIFMAIYLGISQEILDLVGYKTNVCSEFQSATLKSSIKYLISPTPLILLLFSCICMYFYPIDSKKAIENSELIKKINKRRENPAELFIVESTSELVTNDYVENEI
ncbi:unnamed protein product [Brachionus calyciflorus]|uniref:Uncharacterized protein n=1 Tax=Brachionus calyciflorus TaxID=104777 RepID=A0A813T1A0_9BILA|nr:unnamed protein product [Brachionus calyciflorus]